MLGKWRIKSESESERVWAFHDRQNREVGLTNPNRHKYYRYEWLAEGDPPSPVTIRTISPSQVRELSNVGSHVRVLLLSLLGGSTGAILVEVIQHLRS